MNKHKVALLAYSRKLLVLREKLNVLSHAPLSRIHLERLNTQAEKINQIFLVRSTLGRVETAESPNEEKMSSSQHVGLSIQSPELDVLSFQMLDQFSSISANETIDDAHLDKYIECFLNHFNGHPSDLCETFKATYQWDKWPPRMQMAFDEPLKWGFNYYESTSLLLDNGGINLDPEHLRHLQLLFSTTYSDDITDQWAFANFDFDFATKMLLITDNKYGEKPILPYFQKKIGDKLEEALMGKEFPNSYGKIKELMDAQPPSLALILAAQSFSQSYKERAIYDAVKAVEGFYEIEEVKIDDSIYGERIETKVQLPLHAIEKLLCQVSTFKLHPSPEITLSQIEMDINLLMGNRPLNSQQILNFFQQPVHQNMATIKSFMLHMDWSAIKAINENLNPEQERAINRYTMDYLMTNSFLREQFWLKNVNKAEDVRVTLTNEPVKMIWDKFVEDPILNSINAIVQAASVQEALTIAIQKFPSEANKVYRSINFDSQELLMQALTAYIPSDLDVNQLQDGEEVRFSLGVPFEEQSLTSTSEDAEMDKIIEDGGISFAGKWMMTFIYTENVSLQGSLIEIFTDRRQREVLFKIGFKGDIIGIIKNKEGDYILIGQLPSKG